MLSRKYKISSDLFKKNFNKGDKKFSKNMRVVISPSPELDISRFAVIAPKKLFKKAFMRSKQRRRVYAILRETYPQICKGFLVFLYIQKDISKISHTELKEEIISILPLN